MPLSLRPTYPKDAAFVYQLDYQIMAEQLHAWNWEPGMRHQLLHMQIQAKNGSYAATHPNAEYAIVDLDDEAVGRMIIDRSGEFYYLVDIAIIPKQRGGGIGTRLVLALCTEAGLMHKKVRLFVHATNQRALALYRRLGFRVIEDVQWGMVMERDPSDRAETAIAG